MKILITLGIVIIAFGILFSLQGLAVVGPTSSFMYAAPEWTTSGVWIVLCGAIILVVGAIYRIRR